MALLSLPLLPPDAGEGGRASHWRCWGSGRGCAAPASPAAPGVGGVEGSPCCCRRDGAEGEGLQRRRRWVPPHHRYLVDEPLRGVMQPCRVLRSLGDFWETAQWAYLDKIGQVQVLSSEDERLEYRWLKNVNWIYNWKISWSNIARTSF